MVCTDIKSPSVFYHRQGVKYSRRGEMRPYLW